MKKYNVLIHISMTHMLQKKIARAKIVIVTKDNKKNLSTHQILREYNVMKFGFLDSFGTIS